MSILDKDDDENTADMLLEMTEVLREIDSKMSVIVSYLNDKLEEKARIKKRRDRAREKIKAKAQERKKANEERKKKVKGRNEGYKNE